MELSDDNLRTIMERMNASYDEGLAKKDHAAVKQLPSYVRSVPNGTEKGDFLALDLGGTNFRVLLIRLDKNESEMTSKIFRVPESLMRGTGEKVSLDVICREILFIPNICSYLIISPNV